MNGSFRRARRKFGGCAFRASRTLCERFLGTIWRPSGGFPPTPTARFCLPPTPGPPGLVVRRGQPRALRLRPPTPGALGAGGRRGERGGAGARGPLAVPVAVQPEPAGSGEMNISWRFVPDLPALVSTAGRNHFVSFSFFFFSLQKYSHLDFRGEIQDSLKSIYFHRYFNRDENFLLIFLLSATSSQKSYIQTDFLYVLFFFFF